MKKTLITLFAVLLIGPLCAAQAAKQKTGDNDDTADLEVQRQKKVAQACKGRQPGATVTVNGKKASCPAARQKK